MVTVMYQVTLKCTTGEYRPVSALVTRMQENAETNLLKDITERKKIKSDGVINICAKRRWGYNDLMRYNYKDVTMRKYDKEKIEQENKERYERIKQEKYASGEWKPSKKEERQMLLKKIREERE